MGAPMVLDTMGAAPRIASLCVRLLGLAPAIAGLALRFVQMSPVQRMPARAALARTPTSCFVVHPRRCCSALMQSDECQPQFWLWLMPRPRLIAWVAGGCRKAK